MPTSLRGSSWPSGLKMEQFKRAGLASITELIRPHETSDAGGRKGGVNIRKHENNVAKLKLRNRHINI